MMMMKIEEENVQHYVFAYCLTTSAWLFEKILWHEMENS